MHDGVVGRWSLVVVALAPVFGHAPDFVQAGEDIAIQERHEFRTHEKIQNRQMGPAAIWSQAYR